MNYDPEPRRAWARELIRRAETPLPAYGSPEWLALPEGSPERVAAVVVAAEAWAMDGDNIEDRLRCELAAQWQADKAAEDDDYQRRAAEHRERWQGLSARRPRYVGQVARPLEHIGAEHMAGVR